MSKIALILAEGPTEERIIKDLLTPHFAEQGLSLRATIIKTKRVYNGPDKKGGNSFSNFEFDMRNLLRGSGGGSLVTTLMDYYGLPYEFPGMRTRPANGIAIERVKHVEAAIAAHFKNPPNFLPFLVLHETEALLFSTEDDLPDTMIARPAQRREFAQMVNSALPEEINDGRDTAPSKRILKIFPDYGKTVAGPATLRRIGLATIRQRCPHFDAWMNALERYARGY